MMRASLRLTVWLMDRFGIQARNVIGHAETLMSPFHHEAYPSWRCQTHADWQHAECRSTENACAAWLIGRECPSGRRRPGSTRDC